MTGLAQKVVAGLVIAMLGWIIADQRGLRGEVRALDQRMTRLEVSLSERLARLEGRVDTLVEVMVKKSDR